MNRIFGWSFYLFNKAFDAATTIYTRIVGGAAAGQRTGAVLYGGLLGLTYWGLTHTPTGFIPSQDKGYLLVNVQLPDSSSLERTQKVMDRVEAIAGKLPGVAHTLAIAGQSILMNANAPNFGAMYVMLDEFHHRADERAHRPGDRRPACRPQLQAEIKDGLVNIFEAPPVDGLGTAGGFKIVIEDRGDLGPQELEQVANRIVAKSRTRPSPTSTLSRAFSPASGPTRPGCTWTSTATRPSWPGSRSPSCSTPCRSTWARSTSTISTCSAAPGRSTCRETPTSASRSTT